MSFDTKFHKVVFLGHFDGFGDASIIDVKGNALEMYSPAHSISGTGVFGGSSLFPDEGAVVENAHNSANNVDGLTDFCIEFFIKPILVGGVLNNYIVRCERSDMVHVNWAVTIENNELFFKWGSSATSTTYSIKKSAISSLAGAWHFIKCSFTGTTAVIFIDGALQTSQVIDNATKPRLSGSSDYLAIGNDNGDFSGYGSFYLNELRVTIGDSRPETDTVVPTAKFPDSWGCEIVGHVTTTDTPSAAMYKGGGNGINGYVTTTSTPSARMKYGLQGINGSITTTGVPSAVMQKILQFWGFITTTGLPAASLSKIDSKGFLTGFVATRELVAANMVKPVIVPVNWVSRQFLCTLTGSSDLILPASRFNANLVASGTSSLSLSLGTGDSALVDAIVARTGGDLIINRQHVYSDGSIITRPFIQVNYNTLSSAGDAITVSGTKVLKIVASKPCILMDAISRTLSGGLRTYRCAINDALALGDVATINGETFVVGKISYFVDPVVEFMEITEYAALPSDAGASIGTNTQPIMLSAYTIVHTDSNYALWMNSAFFYSGITANLQTIGQPYDLYTDSAGLLWYLPGIEGASNQPVYLSDGVTQAAI